jgi:hypothetical protein
VVSQYNAWRMPEPSLRDQRVYRADDVAAALGKTMQAVKDRVQRGASLRGWSPRQPGNTLRLWLVDADHADAHDAGIAGAGLPSGHWPLPPLGGPDPLAKAQPSGPGAAELFGPFGLRAQEQLEMSQRSEAVEREQRLIAERDAARKEAQDLRVQVDEVRAEMANLRRGVVLMMGGSLPSS